ncbi:hypothetical protein GUJ93_ZPchr0014g47313 [Zizania palustris]|uniref:Uncharacterized protein n=1 Tax=Zizania palustris TaxID=103762 RepID=A0A8J5TKR0_ZIZPA|nr:hypothetical protein GUJ93_ZPchr0014g47313 [Zizania palustris]
MSRHHHFPLPFLALDDLRRHCNVFKEQGDCSAAAGGSHGGGGDEQIYSRNHLRGNIHQARKQLGPSAKYRQSKQRSSNNNFDSSLIPARQL